MFRLQYVAAAAAAIGTYTLPVMAGNTVLTNSKTGQTVAIDCVSAGCTMSYSGGGKPAATRTGPGGTSNFDKNVAQLKSQGFK